MSEQSRNPLISDFPEDTLSHASAVLHFLSKVQFNEMVNAEKEDNFGLSLVLDTVRAAVDDASNLVSSKKSRRNCHERHHKYNGQGGSRKRLG